MKFQGLPRSLVERFRFQAPILVTRPEFPPLEDYSRRLEEVWRSQWLTNFGKLHGELEARLADHLGVECLELVSSGTAGLMVALRALGLDQGEVITTPFTFPATVHSLVWCGLEPVFCDIDEHTLTLDPDFVSESITPRTVAILGVHVYGVPCDTTRLQELAHMHGLRLLYDAAHAFGVSRKGRSILLEGDASVLSFHATKLFSTGEGGAAYLANESDRRQFRLLRNFGIVDEETVTVAGINAKLSELHAAFGLAQLEHVGKEIAGRKVVAQVYQQELAHVSGIEMLVHAPDVDPNYAYFPIWVDPEQFGASRDELYSCLQVFNVFSRKYFYPLCSEHRPYSDLPSASPGRLVTASRAASRVLCLPIYGSLGASAAHTITRIIRSIHEIFQSPAARTTEGGKNALHKDES